MCGRFTLKTPPDQWGQLLLPQLELGSWVGQWQPRYNIAPTQDIVAIVASDLQARNEARLFRWGLVPFWADDLAIGNRMINARSETLAEKPAFRTLLARRRCVILTDGYYEWQQLGKTKQPYWIHQSDQRVFGFLGLWDRNKKASTTEVESATIITCAAGPTLAALHDRMPAILSGPALQAWLDPNVGSEDALALLLDRQVDLDAYPVSSHVNNPRHEDAQCLVRQG